MSTTTQNKPEVIKFHSPQQITSSELLSFTSKYLGSLVELKEYISSNLNKEIKLKFSRMKHDGFFKEIQEVTGQVTDIQENRFTFLSTYNISGEYETDGLTPNIIRTDNILGVLPIFGYIQLNGILKINKINQNGYDRFLKRLKNELRVVAGTERHVEIEINEEIIDATILEVNQSNLLITQYRKHSKATNPDGSYVTVTLAKQIYNLLFIEKDDFVKKVVIYPNNIYFNLHDEG